MGLKTVVKVTNISNLSDARYCAGMGVDMLGFDLDSSSPNYTSPEKFKEITNWVSGPKLVGEFKNAAAHEIAWTAGQYALDYIQISDISLLGQLDVSSPLIFKMEIGDANAIESLDETIQILQGFADLLVLSCNEPALYTSIDQKTADLAKIKVIRSYGIQADEIDDIIQSSSAYGIELQGTPEERPGFNDYGDLMDVLEALEELD